MKTLVALGTRHGELREDGRGMEDGDGREGGKARAVRGNWLDEEVLI